MLPTRTMSTTSGYKAQTTEFHFFSDLPEGLQFHVCQFFPLGDLVTFLLVSKEANRLAQEALPQTIEKEHKKDPEYKMKLTNRALALLVGESKNPKDALVLRNNMDKFFSYGVSAEGEGIIERVLRFGHREVLVLLHQRRVPFDLENAARQATMWDHSNILKFLAEIGTDLNPIMQIALDLENNSLKCIKALCELGYDFNQDKYGGRTLIQDLLQIYSLTDVEVFEQIKIMFKILIDSGIYIKNSPKLKSWFEEMTEKNQPRLMDSFHELQQRYSGFLEYKESVIGLLDSYIAQQKQHDKSFLLFKKQKASNPAQQSTEKAFELQPLRMRFTD